MKEYKLKEEVKQYFDDERKEGIFSFEYWGVPLSMLDEVTKPKELISRVQGGIWINAKDRLPNTIGSYIVFYRDENGMHCMAWAFYNSRKEWCVENEKLIDVTHWMPLPKPPSK